ncbi:MAG: hypothetical protein BJ554DRAFT_7616 [Olpidium bornovanus]|uniref:Uncharacterized protein n=1 Tax=Olpidium bornovanus TaxID=278681 RepID=A0A8H7ZVR8_9FUNG|nr:MAG: hypothetical protein BJ554DRAFT_7616 [Olpidium bornovanus]
MQSRHTHAPDLQRAQPPARLGTRDDRGGGANADAADRPDGQRQQGGPLCLLSTVRGDATGSCQRAHADSDDIRTIPHGGEGQGVYHGDLQEIPSDQLVLFHPAGGDAVSVGGQPVSVKIVEDILHRWVANVSLGGTVVSTDLV